MKLITGCMFIYSVKSEVAVLYIAFREHGKTVKSVAKLMTKYSLPVYRCVSGRQLKSSFHLKLKSLVHIICWLMLKPLIVMDITCILLVYYDLYHC